MSRTDADPPRAEPMSEQRPDAAAAARALWASRLHGVLSTQATAHPGYPFGSLVPYCLDRSGHALLLLSHLAQHRQNLDADPRCALTVAAGDDDAADVQQRPRLTVLAAARPDPDPSHLERYCRYYPDARLYAEQLNFALYRLEPVRAHFNGGFATARWLGRERLLHRQPLTPAAETALLARLNDIQAGRLTAILADRSPGADPVEAVGIDPDGLDLRQARRLVRLSAAALRDWPDLAALLPTPV
jgi:putative heme iron utilization protein